MREDDATCLCCVCLREKTTVAADWLAEEEEFHAACCDAVL